MRQLELKHGIDLVDEDGEVRGKSTVAAKRAVSQVSGRARAVVIDGHLTVYETFL